jgi:hypothetical protein
VAKSKNNRTGNTAAGAGGDKPVAPLTPDEAAPGGKDTVDPGDTVKMVDDTVDTAQITSDDHETAQGAPETDTPETDTMAVGTGHTPEKDDMVPDEGVDVASAEEDDTYAGADPAPVTPPEPQIVKETVVERKGGFVPMLLGGVVAAGLGFVAGAWPDLPFMGPTEVVEDPFVTQTNAALRSQQEQIQATTARSEANAAAVADIDLAPLSASVSDIQDQLTTFQATLTDLSDQMGALDGRVTTLEKQPLIDAVSPETIAAYERELERLQDEVAAQQASVAAAQAEQLVALDAARAEIEAVADRARASELSAENRAKLAANRAALADLTTRARDGQPYAEPLAVLTGNGVTVPDPLSQAAEDGLPTTSILLTEFPDAARDALRAARAAEEAQGDTGGMAGFLQNQLGARSVTPRSGDDPDAVLSRAEAALRSGDLESVLTEIATLPEDAKTELSDWVAMARLRRDALSAAAALSQELNQE